MGFAREEIAGVTYELRPWEPADGQRWLWKILAMAGSVVGMGKGVPLGVVLGTFDEKTFADLWNTCRQYSYRIGAEEKTGAETVARLHELETKKLDPIGTPYLAIVVLMNRHIDREYEDFFQQLPALLGAGRDGSSSKSNQT